MIVRLMGEGQYELDKKHADELNRIDNNIVKIVNRGDEKAYKSEFRKLSDYVRKNGKKYPMMLSSRVKSSYRQQI